jgi:hypothetical protein
MMKPVRYSYVAATIDAPVGEIRLAICAVNELGCAVPEVDEA